ncbi:MAG TPA: protein kinase [Candidatus Xenobia bacterium]|jgi:serine/threonine-protein kinase
MLATGSLVQGRYRIERLVGRGGMGTVYQATEEELGKRVAIKAMTIHISDPVERERALRIFRNEARMLAALDHPGLVDVTHYFTEGDQQYLVMSFVDGTTLEAKWREAQGFLPIPTALEWMDEVAGILDYLHGRQPPVVVRDLKPANIMLDQYGRVRLIDFGIARCLDAKETTTFSGTPGYASLEQFGGTTDPRADIYAAGATLYTLLTGNIPPPSIDLILQTSNIPAPSSINPEVGPALEEVVLKFMALQAEDRYQTIREARDALRAVQTSAKPRVRYCAECGTPVQGSASTCQNCAAALRGAIVPPKAKPLEFAPETAPLEPAARPKPKTVAPAAPRVPLSKPRAPSVPKPAAPVTQDDGVEGRYVIEKPLGEFRFLGYRYGDKLSKVVVKSQPGPFDPAAVVAFRKAAVKAASLSHPNLVRVLEHIENETSLALVTEFVEGVSLDRLLAKLDGFLPVPLALSLCLQLFDTVSWLHERGVVVGDLRLDHVLATSGGSCKLADLGLRPRPPTPGFSAPERYGGPATPASDLYSLGAMVYAIFTRQVPPPAPELASGAAFLASPELLNAHVPPRLRAVVSRLLHVDPTQRFATAAEARKSLDWAFESPKTDGHAPPEVPGGHAPERSTVKVPPPAPRPEIVPARPASAADSLPPIEGLDVEAAVGDPSSRLLGHRGTTRHRVQVVEFSLRHVVFVSVQTWRVRSTLPIRFSVKSPLEDQAVEFTGEVVLTKVSPSEGDTITYTGTLRGIPPAVKTELQAAAMGRRRAKRLRENFQVTCTEPPFKALGIDISATGVGIMASDALPDGRVVELLLDLNDLSNADPSPALRMTVHARAMHSIQRGPGRFEIGLEFTSLSPRVEQVLRRYLKV